MRILIVTELMVPYRVNWFNELGKYANVTVLYTKEKEKTRNNQWLSSRPKNCTYIKLKEMKLGKFEICFNILKELKSDEYDIILLDGYSFPTQMLGILYLKFSNKIFVMNMDGGFIKEQESSIARKVKQFFIKSPNYYLSTSKHTDKYLQYYGADVKNIFHHNFSSLYKEDIMKETLTFKQKKKVKDELNIKEEKMVISVGRFIYEKGLDVLLKACKDLPEDYGIYIIGGEPTKEYLSLVDKYDLKNVYFVGFKTKDELKKYYEAADLFILPTRGDVWGLVVNEALACGLPIITTDRCIAGLELVENYKNGFIVPVNNETKLAEKINYILSSEDVVEKMSSNSLEKIKDFTIENMAKRNIEAFDVILNKKFN